MIQNSPSGGTIQPSSLNATVGRVAAVATALLLVAFLVLSVSRAAFTASTANESNFVTTDGFVTLSDNDQGSALFELTDIGPGTPTTECIHVQYEGTATSGDVNMYATVGDPAPVTNLAPYLNVEVNAIEIADALFDPLGAAPDCVAYSAAELAAAVPTNPQVTNVYNGTLDGFADAYADDLYAFDGVASTYAFEITVEVQDDAAASDARADWSFTWETQG